MSNTRLAEVFLRTNLISSSLRHTAEIYLPLVGKKTEKISPSLGPDLHFTFTLPTLTCNEVLFVTTLSAFGWEKKKGEDKSTSDGPRFANNISLQVCVHKCIWTWIKSEKRLSLKLAVRTRFIVDVRLYSRVIYDCIFHQVTSFFIIAQWSWKKYSKVFHKLSKYRALTGTSEFFVI